MVRTGMAFGLALLAALPALAAEDVAALKTEGGEVIKAYGGTLLGALKGAMEKGGPVEAIAACNDKAPAVAAQLSGEKGWKIGRTSHRPRNPNSAPDAFEAKVIEDFLARLDKGEKADSLVHAEVVEQDGDRVFRMVKAIPTAELCVTCHGGELAPEIKARLGQLYPQDRATGFKPGDMRGVFSVSKRI